MWVQKWTHNFVGAFESDFQDEVNCLKTIREKIGKNGATLLKDVLVDLVKNLGATVIMPASDNFMFKGISRDNGNNIFTTIAYNTQIGDSVEEKASKDVSLHRWQAPKSPTTKKA